MRISNEYLDITFLDENFSISGLWHFREQVGKLKTQLEELELEAIRECRPTTAVKYGKQLHYVNRNLDSIEYVMTEKENDIFLFTKYGDACLN